MFFFFFVVFDDDDDEAFPFSLTMMTTTTTTTKGRHQRANEGKVMILPMLIAACGSLPRAHTAHTSKARR
jgi:hypothetical protein|tara:strand:+ start:979 stop:1188 length:210 start_codon:yes stop_codon:yes gene_type:complete